MADQAVLIIHGIGEQRPLDTLRSFVHAVWTSDTRLHKDHAQGGSFWSKPYTLSQDFELRRLTTAQNKAGLKTDFYEFYWAHLLQGTKLSHLWSWMLSLLWRRPASVPGPLRLLFVVLWCLVIAGVGLSVYAAWQSAQGHAQAWWLKWVLGFALVPLVSMVLTDIVGDAARYLHPAPPNIQSRHAIRAAGLKVLEALHHKGYQRIVIVGHSLGTVIAHDIINHAWVAMSAAMPAASGDELQTVQKLEQMAVQGETDTQLWQAAQRKLFNLRCAAGGAWRVSDLITLGSPLAHAQVLLAASENDLRARMAARELPSCPPALETTPVNKQNWAGFSYPAGAESRRLHHAAPFALTRWTNLYFPCRLLVWGDLVGGPVAPVFGPAVRDVAVTTTHWRGLLSHTFYWQPDTHNQHLGELRKALDLLDNEAQA